MRTGIARDGDVAFCRRPAPLQPRNPAPGSTGSYPLSPPPVVHSRRSAARSQGVPDRLARRASPGEVETSDLGTRDLHHTHVPAGKPLDDWARYRRTLRRPHVPGVLVQQTLDEEGDATAPPVFPLKPKGPHGHFPGLTKPSSPILSNARVNIARTPRAQTPWRHPCQSSRASPAEKRRITCLTRRVFPGAMIRAWTPRPSISKAPRGSPASSPQTATETPRLRAPSAANRIASRTAGVNGSNISPIWALVRSVARTYCVRSLVPMEMRSTSATSSSMRNTTAGTSTMIPNRGCAAPLPSSLRPGKRGQSQIIQEHPPRQP